MVKAAAGKQAKYLPTDKAQLLGVQGVRASAVDGETLPHLAAEHGVDGLCVGAFVFWWVGGLVCL